jgi:hypothetical protein
MKINRKALQLIEKGLTSKTVSKLTESQIDVLHSKLLGEQLHVPKGSPQEKEAMAKKQAFVTYEEELDEDDDFDLDADQSYTGQLGSHDADQPADDGMDDDTSPQNHDSKMIGMSEENEDGPNPWAICHAQVGPKKSRKWERCVMSVKKQLKEGKNPVSLFLESQIEKIVEKHLPPRITKGDLLKVISETSTTAPVKEPITKPTTKPRTRPAHPGQNPNPGEHPAPKAKKSETKESTTAPVKEPITKPTTKPRTRPAHPGQNPNPGEHPAPKATKISPEQAKDTVIDTIMKLLEK